MNKDPSEHDAPNPNGWDAIDRALVPIYGDQEPAHFGTTLPAALGGDDCLQGISAYKRDQPQPHFHFVTYGFTELYEKENKDPEHSGFGFELTFRLACNADDVDPPVWVLNFLQNLARYVFKSGNYFDERHYLPLNGPICLGTETDVTAIMMTLDPELGEIDTPNGHVKFLQIVGLCTDELTMIKEGYANQILEGAAASAPLGITDIYRESLLADPEIAKAIRASEPVINQSELFGTLVEWQDKKGEVHVRIGATLVEDVLRLLEHRLSKGEPFAVYGEKNGVVFRSGDANAWESLDTLLQLTLTTEMTQGLAEKLKPIQGTYRWTQWTKLVIEVVRIEIKDSTGRVSEIVG